MPVGSLALYAENEFLEHIVGKAAIFSIPTVYVALFIVSPTHEDGTGGTEASLGNYARKSTAAADWNNAANGAIDNANAITFIECADADWGEINGFALYDALSAGNMLVWGNLTTPKTITITDTLQFPAGDLNVTLD